MNKDGKIFCPARRRGNGKEDNRSHSKLNKTLDEDEVIARLRELANSGVLDEIPITDNDLSDTEILKARGSEAEIQACWERIEKENQKRMRAEKWNRRLPTMIFFILVCLLVLVEYFNFIIGILPSSDLKDNLLKLQSFFVSK